MLKEEAKRIADEKETVKKADNLGQVIRDAALINLKSAPKNEQDQAEATFSTGKYFNINHSMIAFSWYSGCCLEALPRHVKLIHGGGGDLGYGHHGMFYALQCDFCTTNNSQNFKNQISKIRGKMYCWKHDFNLLVFFFIYI